LNNIEAAQLSQFHIAPFLMLDAGGIKLDLEPLENNRNSAFKLVSPHLISHAEPNHHAEKTHLNCLYLQSRSFSHDPKLVIIYECWNIDGPVN